MTHILTAIFHARSQSTSPTQELVFSDRSRFRIDAHTKQVNKIFTTAHKPPSWHSWRCYPYHATQKWSAIWCTESTSNQNITLSRSYDLEMDSQHQFSWLKTIQNLSEFEAVVSNRGARIRCQQVKQHAAEIYQQTATTNSQSLHLKR